MLNFPELKKSSMIYLSEKDISIIQNNINKNIHLLSTDVYWPKWNNPWWFILFLAETDNYNYIPQDILFLYVEKLKNQYLHFFPISESELGGKTINGFSDIICFCFLGCIFKVYSLCGIDILKEVPWLRDWPEKYQLPDGGYNCDETAYVKSMKSSLISTCAMIEGMLEYAKFKNDREIFKDEIQKGISYILSHKIMLSSTGKIIPGTNWDKIIFPMFYEYDFVRGLDLVLSYSEFVDKKLDIGNLDNVFSLLNTKLFKKNFSTENKWIYNEKNYKMDLDSNVIKYDINIPDIIKKFIESDKNYYIYLRLKKICDKTEKLI